jgi:signal transduction histidine kinase
MATILIVDDHPTNRELLLALLNHANHRLLEAVDGVEAMQLVRSEHPDLVITDILMPKIDGYELVRRIRADSTLTQPRVIFITATYLETEAATLARACGVKHFLLKPIEPQRLLDLVSTVLDEPAPAADELTTDIAVEHLHLLTNKLHRHVSELELLNSELDRRVADRTAELEAANKELEAFSYSVSHDLRAPLRSISGSSAILQEDFSAALPAGAVHHLDRIRDNIQQMSQLIDDLLGFARTARQPLVRATVQMEPLARECVGEFSAEIATRNIRLEVGKLPECSADVALLKQVLRNLVGNAVKYTRRQPHPLIEIGCRSANDEQIFYVKDNGAGFDMAYVDKLFGVFQRLHRDEDFEGTGVGLATVQRILNRHGGRVWAEGKVNEGATFYFTLPKRRYL